MRGRIAVRISFHIFLYTLIIGVFGFMWIYTPKRGDWQPKSNSLTVNLFNPNIF